MKTIEWAAGLFEGEGCITVYKGNYPKLCLTMTDFDVVEEFFKIVGVGSTYVRPAAKEHWKDQLTWYVRKRADVKELLEKMLPYFGQRRAEKALSCLDDINKLNSKK